MDISFGRWIRRRRRLLDLTQKELAGRVGCSPVTVRKLESDERRPSKQLADRLAQSLAIPADEVDRFLAYARTAPAFDSRDDQEEPDAGPRLLLAAAGPIHVDWGEAPDVRRFYGRTQELDQLRRWLIYERCRLVGIVGMGGIGKTSLATKLAHLVQGQFEVVIWRSLRNAPPVEEILDEILRVVRPGAALDLVPNLDRQIKQLLDHLRHRRCLMILDNVEAVLAEGERAGTYRAGYAGYGELLERVGESSHQSCLLVTSRENPTGLGIREGAGTAVHVLQLSSLAPDDSRALLAGKGLSGQAESFATLSAWYSGNPLVLQVVGHSIRELFQGSVDTFLRYETTLFDGIRDLLSRQVARLSSLEQSVFIWLAIHREPVEPEVLRDEIEPAPRWAALLDALHSLRQRSLVEQSERGFTLQNVVLEFMTDHLVEQIVREVTVQEPVLFQRYALLQAQERQFVRDSQTRLLLKPVVDHLVAALGRAGVEAQLRTLLGSLRQGQAHTPGYGAGNLLNLLVHLDGHLRGHDFSGLVVRQANLQGVEAQDASFRGAHLDRCDFTSTFKSVVAVAFSPAGDYLIVGADTGVYCMRRLQDNHRFQNQMEPSRSVWQACCSPDSTLVAAAGNDGTVRIWVIATGRCLHTLEGHVGPVWFVCYSPDGHRIASGGADSSVRIWDVRSGRCLVTLLEHTKGVRGLDFSPGGEWLASAGEDGTVRLWDLRQLPEEVRSVRILREHTGMAWSVAFSPDGALLAAAGTDRIIRLWDAQTGRLLKTLTGHTQYVTRICFNPAGTLLASGSYDATVRVWDSTTGQCVRTLQGHASRVWSVAFSPDGAVLASGSADQSVRLWDVEPVSGSGRCLKTLHGYSNTIRSVSFSPDGALLASSGQDTLVRLWEARTGRCLAALPGHLNDVWNVGFSPDGRLLASAGHDSTVRVWDVASGRCLQTLERQHRGCDATSFHPSGAVLATANHDRSIDLWDVRTWHLLATLQGHTAEVWAVSFSPDGALLASGSMDYSVRLWDWHSGRCLHTLQGHTSYVRAVVFSPDGRLLASSSWDGTVRLWDLAPPAGSPCELATLVGPGGAAQLYVAFSPDGRLLASAGVDATVCLWERADAVKGSPPLCVLEGHAGKVYSVSFRPDGGLLASGSGDGSIRLWDVTDVRRGVACVQVLQVELPYARMNIAGVTGLSQAQITSLQALGAVEEGGPLSRPRQVSLA